MAIFFLLFLFEEVWGGAGAGGDIRRDWIYKSRMTLETNSKSDESESEKRQIEQKETRLVLLLFMISIVSYKLFHDYNDNSDKAQTKI